MWTKKRAPRAFRVISMYRKYWLVAHNEYNTWRDMRCASQASTGRFFVLFFSFFFTTFYMYICIGPTSALPKKGKTLNLPLFLRKYTIFWYTCHKVLSELSLEEEITSAEKRSVCVLSVWDRYYRFGSFDRSVLGNSKNIRTAYIYVLYIYIHIHTHGAHTRDILSEIVRILSIE